MAQFTAGEVLTAAKLNTAINGRTINNLALPSYTLVSADAGKIVLASASVQQTVTVPADASVLFPTGTAIGVFANNNASVSVLSDSGVTINTPAGSASVVALPTAYTVVELVKIGADLWNAVVIGEAATSGETGGGGGTAESGGLSPLLLIGA